MKSLQKSWGKNCPKVVFCLLVAAVAGLASCQSSRSPSRGTLAPERPIEASLSEDQKAIEKLRKNIPPAQRAENDQLREILNMTGEVKENPSRIREKFSRESMRMRELHRREMQKERDQFNRDEKKARDQFYAKLKKERDRMKNKKQSREDQKAFYDQQEQSRRDFSSDERDKRSRFNADQKMKDDDFNNLMRDRNNEFTAQIRDYTLRYEEHKKQEAERRKNSLTPAIAPSATPVVTEPLKTGDDEK